MMKNRAWLRLIKAIGLLSPIAAIVLFSQNYLFYHSDYSTERVRDFYNEAPHSLDVVLIGASEVYTGFSPVYAYDQYGFTSFMYSVPDNPAELYVHELKEILSRQSPQLIVVEMQSFIIEDWMESSESDARVVIENIPMSSNKLDAIRTIPIEDKLSLLFPFLKYHGEWKNGPAAMAKQFENRMAFRTEPCLLKGESTHTVVDLTVPENDWCDDYTEQPMSPYREKNLVDFLEYCRSNGMDNVLFVRFPRKLVHPFQYQRFYRSNRAMKIVESYGYPMMDLEHAPEDYGLDMMTDFYNLEHLNQYGRLKTTDVLCDYFFEECGLVPREQTPENRAYWDRCIPYVEAFHEIITEMIERGRDIRVNETPDVLKKIEVWMEE